MKKGNGEPMTIQDIANELEDAIEGALSTQEVLAGKIADMICEWDNKLSPIKAVMAKYGIKYSNPGIGRRTSKGVIVGGDDDLIYVLSDKTVRAVNPETDEYVIEEKTYALKEYISICNLKVMRCGFESVALVSATFASYKNNELSAFLEENKGYLLNQQA